MNTYITRLLNFFRTFAAELERVLPRPVVPLVASLAIHLLLLPFAYVVILFEPEPDETEVFMLEGGIASGPGGEYESERDEDWEDVLREMEDEDEVEEDLVFDDDEDLEEIDYDDEEKFDQWGLPRPGARFTEEDEDDPDWDSDWFDNIELDDEDDDGGSSVTSIIDDDLDPDYDDVLDEDEYEIVDLDDYDIELSGEEEDEEELDEQLEKEIEKKYGSDLKKWDSIFAEAEEEGDGPPSPVKKPPATSAPEVSAVEDPIMALIDTNPYEYLSEGNEDEPLDPLSGTLPVVEDPRLPELLDWMPSDSLMAALISLDLLRAREDREELERTFQSLGYFHQIAGGSELSFFDDIDAVLIASGDPLDVEETFVILRHRLGDEEIQEAIDAQFESLGVDASWYEVDGRRVVQPKKEDFEKLPWIYFIPRPGYVAVLHISKRERLTTYMGSESFGPGAETRLIGDLERHMRMGMVVPSLELAQEHDGQEEEDEDEEEEVNEPPIAVALGSVLFGDAFKAVVDGGPFPVPGEVMLTGRFPPSGDVHIQGSAVFAEEEDVGGFLDQWKSTTGLLKKDTLLKLIGVDGLLGLAEFTQESEHRLKLDARVTPEEVGRLLALVRLLTAEPEEKLSTEQREQLKEKKDAEEKKASSKKTPKKSKKK